MLTEEEKQEKRRNGLCFTCDEKFGPNHMQGQMESSHDT